jgi:hypothetical protein
MELNKMKNARFEASPETAEMSRRIVAVLTGVNNEISDKALGQIIGVEIAPDNCALQAALRQMERAEPPVCFRRRRGIGWKREADADLVQGSEEALKKLSRGARRGSVRLGKVVNHEALSNGMQLQWATNQTRLCSIEDAASARKPRRSAKSVSDLKTALETIIKTVKS